MPDTDDAVPQRLPVFRAAEVRVPSTGAAWSADVDEYEGGVMRLRLQPDALDAMPTWAKGMSVDCTVDMGKHRYYSAAKVLRQLGNELRLRVPREWLQADRRASPRRQGGFTVLYRTDDHEGSAACVDISEGGMCLRVAEALPLRKRLELTFLLPGDRPHTWAQGTVVYIVPAAAHRNARVGIAFTRVALCSRERIARYCADAVATEPQGVARQVAV